MPGDFIQSTYGGTSIQNWIQENATDEEKANIQHFWETASEEEKAKVYAQAAAKGYAAANMTEEQFIENVLKPDDPSSPNYGWSREKCVSYYNELKAETNAEPSTIDKLERYFSKNYIEGNSEELTPDKRASLFLTTYLQRIMEDGLGKDWSIWRDILNWADPDNKRDQSDNKPRNPDKIRNQES